MDKCEVAGDHACGEDTFVCTSQGDVFGYVCDHVQGWTGVWSRSGNLERQVWK